MATVSDTYQYEFSEIARNCKDSILERKAVAILISANAIGKEMSDMNALSLKRVLYLFGKSSALRRDADELRYEVLLQRLGLDRAPATAALPNGRK